MLIAQLFIVLLRFTNSYDFDTQIKYYFSTSIAKDIVSLDELFDAIKAGKN